MARITTTFTQTATAKVPYHFICNYCGKRNDKVQEVTGGASRMVAGWHDETSAMARGLDVIAENDLMKEIKRIDSKIKDYGEGLKQGRTASLSLVSELKGEELDYLGKELHDATCSHCGKKQAWGMNPNKGKLKMGCLVGVIGILVLGLLASLVVQISRALGIMATIICGIGVLALTYILSKRKVESNQAKIAAEPNDPDKLPVLDLEGMKSEHGLHFNL